MERIVAKSAFKQETEKVVNAKFRKDEMYLCDQYRFSLLETCTKFFILRGKLLAVAAPKKRRR